MSNTILLYIFEDENGGREETTDLYEFAEHILKSSKARQNMDIVKKSINNLRKGGLTEDELIKICELGIFSFAGTITYEDCGLEEDETYEDDDEDCGLEEDKKVEPIKPFRFVEKSDKKI